MSDNSVTMNSRQKYVRHIRADLRSSLCPFADRFYVTSCIMFCVRSCVKIVLPAFLCSLLFLWFRIWPKASVGMQINLALAYFINRDNDNNVSRARAVDSC